MVNKDPKQVFMGLSTDDKPPASKTNNGAVFLEIDTSKIYFFDAENAEWLEWGGSNA